MVLCLHVREIELGIDTSHEHIDSKRNNVDITASLAVSEKGCSSTPVRTGHDAELGGCDRSAPVIMSMKRYDDRIPPSGICAEILDLIRIDICCLIFYGLRKIDYRLFLRRRLQYIHYRIADLDREFWLGRRETFWRILKYEFSSAVIRIDLLGDHLSAVCRKFDAFFA